MLRVKHGAYFVADCRTVAEVAALVDLATLVPEQWSSGPWGHHSPFVWRCCSSLSTVSTLGRVPPEVTRGTVTASCGRSR